MSEKKQLKDEELEKVSGGGNCASPEYLPSTHGAHIYASELAAHKELYINKKFYCVSDKDNKEYAVVTLLDVGKKYGNGIWEKVNILEIPTKFYTGTGQTCYVGKTYELSEVWYTMYAYN